MGHKKLPTFAEVTKRVEETCGWPYVYAVFAGEALGPAMRAKPNDHVECPFPSHGGENDFRFTNNWDVPGDKWAGKAICTCEPRLMDAYVILHKLGLFGSKLDALNAVAALVGLSDTEGAPKAQPVPIMPVRAPRRAVQNWTPALSKRRQGLYSQLWKEAYRLDHPEARIGRVYLLNRGIDLSNVLVNIRYHPAVFYGKKDGGKEKIFFPALLFDVSLPNGERGGLHRIFLDEFGFKAPVEDAKKLMPYIAESGYTGCAARVVTVDDCPVLNVAEGPENSLVAYLCTGETAWCAIDTSRLKSLKVPKFFRKVRIWADNDTKHAGAIAVSKLVNRLVAEGFEVEVMMPNGKPGEDWNDIFISSRAMSVSLAKRLPYMRMFAESIGSKIAA